MDLHAELLALQKKMVQRMHEQIKDVVREDTPVFKRYRDEYEAEVRRFARIATQKELIEKVAKSDIVYCGDYHTLAQAQRTPVKILEHVFPRKPKIILCVEAVMSHHQKHLDAYMRGEISEEQFLRRIDYAHTWGFVWEHYKVLFEFAREHGIAVFGINSHPQGLRDRLAARDKHAAKIIADLTTQHPDSLIFVLDGDWHVAYPHLPKEVEHILKKRRLTRRWLIIFQNSERIYWQLASRRLEHRVDVVQISKNRYCVINATPLAKLRTYLNWIEDIEELGYSRLWRVTSSHAAIEDDLMTIINAIADFLDLPKEGLDDFSVYTNADLEFLVMMLERRHFTEPEVKELKSRIEHDTSLYFESGRIIFLANLSLNHAAEEAAHFINHICAGGFHRHTNPRQRFYQAALREALGFLGSKIINQRRRCYTEEDFRQFLKRRSSRSANNEETTLRRVAKHILSHRRYEQRAHSIRKKSNPPYAFLKEPPEILNLITHHLGYLLGNGLFYALIRNRIPKEWVRLLFCENFKTRRPFDVYMDVSFTLQDARCFNVREVSDNLTEEVSVDG